MRRAKPTSLAPSAPLRNSVRLQLLRLAGRTLARTGPARGAQPRRVLLLRPDHVGDVLLTAPAVALVRASLPAAHLTYLVGPWSLAAARHGPPVDRLRALPYPGFTRQPRPNALAPYPLLLREAARLRRETYDLALIFRPDHWWGALLALVAGIPLRVGGDTPETAPLLTHVLASTASQHAADQALDLARRALEATNVVPRTPPVQPAPFHIPEPARAAAADLWRRLSLDGQRVVAIQPSAGAVLKSWPVQRWAQLGDALLDDHVAVVLVGAPDDGPLLSAVLSHMHHAAPLAHGQPLELSAAIYQRSSLLVAVDSGAAHLAAAVGTPTVRLYGPAPVTSFGPWPARLDQRVLVTSKLACVPCGHLESPPCGARKNPACMLALDVDDVMNAVQEQLHP
jgi:ADP-heptose:LPS heptosyltransferase